MHDLSKCMNAGIGASGSEDVGPSGELFACRRGHFALYGLGVVLYLPAAVTRAFVFEF